MNLQLLGGYEEDGCFLVDGGGGFESVGGDVMWGWLDQVGGN